jgi:hypothetical protein
MTPEISSVAGLRSWIGRSCVVGIHFATEGVGLRNSLQARFPAFSPDA